MGTRTVFTCDVCLGIIFKEHKVKQIKINSKFFNSKILTCDNNISCCDEYATNLLAFLGIEPIIINHGFVNKQGKLIFKEDE